MDLEHLYLWKLRTDLPEILQGVSRVYPARDRIKILLEKLNFFFCKTNMSVLKFVRKKITNFFLKFSKQYSIKKKWKKTYQHEVIVTRS